MADSLARLQSALRGRYTIERELGRGGMATVYLARDEKHQRPVALKVLRPELATALGPDRFVREIALAAPLAHPHILPIYDSGEAAGLLYYVTPFIEGDSLRDLLQREGALSLDDALRISREIADALSYAHSRGIIHRDIKPENVLLSGGHAVVADFGIARAVDAAGGHLTETGLALGTPVYMSPEQAAGESKVDGRADIYALGCVLYEMLAGAPPHQGPNAQAILARRIAEPAPPLRTLRDTLPPTLEAAVQRALARHPADRFTTAAAFREALAAAASDAPGAPASREPSIAVLPFRNLGRDPDQEYFSDGLTEELISTLARVAGLHVVSRTSAFAFKERQGDIRTIAQQLNVATVLEGSVRWAGRRLRLSVQLVNAADGYQIWGETYERELEDVFRIQDEISRAIVETLKVRLLGEEPAPAVRRPTRDFEAYTLYLKGRQCWNNRSEADLHRALGFFRQALERDPEYPQALAGLADTYVLLGFYELLPPQDAFPRAKAAARQAASRDPELAEAYPAMAYVRFYYEWAWEAAERDFQTALRLHPGYATAHQWYGNFLAILGRGAESVAAFSRAVELDPLSPVKVAALGWGHYFAGNYAMAQAQYRQALALDPRLSVGHLWMGQVLEALERLEEAEQALVEAVRLDPGSTQSRVALARVQALQGRPDAAATLLEELNLLEIRQYVSSYDLALLHLVLGDQDRSLGRLEQALVSRSHRMAFLKVDPQLAGLRGDERFRRLLDRLAFP